MNFSLRWRHGICQLDVTHRRQPPLTAGYDGAQRALAWATASFFKIVQVLFGKRPSCGFRLQHYLIIISVRNDEGHSVNLLGAFVLILLVQVLPSGEALQSLGQAVRARDLQADVQKVVHRVALVPALAAFHLYMGVAFSPAVTARRQALELWV